MKTEFRAVTWSIWLVLLSAVCGWLFFEIAIFTDLLVESAAVASTGSTTALYGQDAVQLFRPSKYLLFAAIAVFGVGSLIAQKRLIRLRASTQDRIPLARAGQEFANTAIIVSLAIAAWAALAVFMESFVEFANADISIGLRLINTYLPIILYTVFVVTVLLAAFVFRKHQLSATGRKKSQTDLPADTARIDEPADAQRNIGLSFAIPIIAVAIALIFGLIVFDVTQTAIQVWIWVIIQVVIGGGIVVGTFLAQKAIDAYRASQVTPTGASIGAKNLNFVLSIIFAAVLSFMSLIYGVAAVEQLRVSPALTLSVYSNQTKESISETDQIELSLLTMQVNGSDLQRNSDVTVQLDSAVSNGGGREIAVLSGTADRDGNYWSEQPFEQPLKEGSYSLSLTAVSADGSVIQRDLAFNVVNGQRSTWPNGTDTYMQDEQGLTVMPITIGWVLSDLLPALLLLALAALAIYLTLRIRNAPHDEVSA